MAVYKATKKKEESAGTFKATEKKSVDTSMVYGWEKTYNESYDTLDKYSKRIEGEEYLSSDDLSAYEKAMNSYVDAVDNMRFLSKSMGKNLIDDKEWENSVSQMRENFKGIYDHYSRFDTKEKYDSAVAANKEYEHKKNLDIEAELKEIEDWEAAAQGYVNCVIEPHWQDHEVTDEEKVAAIERLDPYAKKYGGVDVYGDITDMLGIIEERKAYINDAKRIQEGIKLASVADPASELYDPEFGQHSEYVDQEEKSIQKVVPFYKDVIYDAVNNNESGFTLAMGSTLRSLTASDFARLDAVKEMNDEERSLYNYYYAKHGYESAEKYLDSIMNDLNHRMGEAIYKPIEDKWALEMLFGVVAGFDQFSSGMKSLFSTDDYIPTSAIQYASGMVREDLADDSIPLWYNFKEGQWEDKVLGNSLGQIAYDATTTTANMLPSMLVSTAANYVAPGSGAVVGSALLGSSAAGNAYKEMINLGYNKKQASNYAALVGASEAGLQYLLGGIGKMGGKLTGNAISKIVSGVDNALARTAIKLGGSMLSEWAEEGLQEILDPWFQNLTLHTNKSVNWNDVAYSSLLGALTAGFMEGSGIVATEVGTYRTGKGLQAAGISAQRLAEIGSTFSSDSVAYQLAGKVNENTGAYTLGRLFNEIGAELTEANKAEIAQELEKRGVSAKDARVMVDAMANVVLGGSFTDKQIAILEANDVLTKAVVDVVINPNSTVNQRSQGYREVLADIAKQKTEKASQAEPVSQNGENATVENTAPTETETASQGDYEAAVEGKTIRKSTGEAVNIKEVASVDAGKMTLRLEDGSEVDSKELAYSSAEEAYVFETVANLGVDAKEATRLINAFHNSGVDGKTFADGMRLAFEYGYGNFSQQELARMDIAGNIPQMYINTAYEIGQKVRQQEGNNPVSQNGGEYALRTQKSTAIDSARSNSEAVDLSNDNELSERVAGLFGAEKYKAIQQYILEVLGDQPITLKDGKQAVVDRSDALHIANKAASKKTAQISKIKELVENADLYAEDKNVEHNKFDYFCYYRADVKYGEDQFPVYLNVGRGKNDGKYHIYDITNKIRDTADRINGLERPKPNEGYALTSGISKTSIRNPGKTVNKKVSGKARGVYYTTKDGKAIPVDQAEKNGKLALKDKQSVAVKTAQFLHKLGVGSNYYFFESYVDSRGNRVFKDRFGNIQSAPHGLYYSDGDIYIDINAGTDSHSITLRTLSHELTHMIQQWSAAKYKAIADFLAEQYDKEGRNAYEAAKAKQAELSELRGKRVSFQEAYHEFVADSMSTLFDDGNMYDILTALKKKDKTLVDYIKKFFDGLKAKVRELYGNKQAETDEGQFVQGLSKDTIYRLQQLFADALVDAGENYAASEQKNTDAEIGVQEQTRMTDADIQAVQSIGRIGVNQFSASDIKATERFAQQYWKEMGTKSPFFRAWFGDWRANDQTKVQVVTQKGDARGVQKNTDTGWDIQVSGKVFNETRVHTKPYNIAARAYLPYINDIVRNAVLLDSSGVDIGRAKSNNSLLMHSFYSVADIGNGPEIIKLYVEEMNNPNDTSTGKRAYQLQNIEKYHLTTKSSQNSASSRSVASGTIRIVADLFAAVKQKDSSFQPKPASKVVNADGTPMVVYHGSAEQFTAFSYGSIGSSTGVGILGDGFYFTDKEKLAKDYGANVYPVYLQMKNPYMATESDAYKLKVADLQAKGYDGVILHAPSGNVYMVFENTQIKSATDNIGTFDGNNPDIRYQDRAAAPSNRALLAQALEGVAANVEDYQTVQEYRQIVPLLDAEEAKLSRLNAQIREMTFGKGSKDREKLTALRLEAKQTQNRIDSYDEQLLKLEATAPIRRVLEREKTKAYKKAAEKGKEAVRKEKENAQAKYKELAEKNAAARKKGIDSRARTALRHKVQSVVRELNDLLLSNDKKRHVPDSMKKAVADALSLVNMDTVGAEERVAKYAALIENETDPDKIEAYTVTMENIRRQGEKVGQRLSDLHSAYEEIQNSEDPDMANAYDPVIAGSLKELAQSIGNTPIRDMSAEQLSDVYDMYRMVLTRVRDANKAFAEGISASIADMASSVIREVKSAGGEHTYRAAALDPVRKFQWDNLKPVYAMERLGSATMSKVFETVRAGEDTWAKDVVDARKYYLDKSKKYGYDSWDFDKKTKFESASGVEFELSLEQILSLYAYSKRDQAADHLRLGGFVFDSNIETHKEKGSKLIKYKVNTAEAHQITPEILAEITGTLTPEQKAFVDEMQDYLSTVMGAKGNEVTMKMYGVKLFKEKFYFPLKSARQFMFEQNEVSGEVRIKNSGFTNKVIARANNPVILNNFMDVWSGHVNDMSMYHAFVLPLEDFNRVFNYNSPKSEGQQSVSVKGTIQNAYSPAAVSYMKQLITDLNGGVVTDPRETLAKTMIAKFKKAKVFSSASVVIQQPSAIGRAFALVDPKYFHFTKDGMKHSELWSEVKQYAPVAIIKEMGYFDTDMGRSTKDFITAKEYSGIKEKAKALFADGTYRDEVLSKAPALADEITWCAIWNAVKRETKAKNPELNIKSEELLKKAGKRFTEVITKTQVYDSVLSRSANMRSKSGLMSMATSFMAEPTTTINMIEDALIKAKRGNKKYAARAFAAAAVSILLNNALVALVYGARDDDEDETYLEKYSQAFLSNTLDDINPITYYPFLKDMWSLLQGYDVERADMSLVADMTDALKGLVKAYTSDNGDVAGAWWDIAGSAANIGGIPAQNISRDVKGAINLVKTLIDDASGRETTWGSMGDALGDAVRDSLPVVGWLSGETKGDKLYDAIVNGDGAYVDRLKSGYKDESSYRQAVRKALRENDSRIKEAAEAKVNGDSEEYLRLAKEIIAEKHFAQDDVVAAINAEINALLKAKKSETQ